MFLLQLVYSIKQRQVFVQPLHWQNDARSLEIFVIGELEHQQILKLDKSDNIGPVLGVNRYLRVIVLLQIVEKLLINNRILIDHENVIEGDHIILDLL